MYTYVCVCVYKERSTYNEYLDTGLRGGDEEANCMCASCEQDEPPQLMFECRRSYATMPKEVTCHDDHSRWGVCATPRRKWHAWCVSRLGRGRRRVAPAPDEVAWVACRNTRSALPRSRMRTRMC